jgi:predicted O-linked N-acetylglucosamine transferase (SPINDLY family)
LSPAWTIDQALETALQHHRAGQLREAEAIYRQVLARQPDNADALNLLGFLAHQVNRRPEALELIRRAIALRPRAADFYHNLAVVLAAEKRFDEAVAGWRQTLAIRPGDVKALTCIAAAQEAMGRLAEAAQTWREVCRVQPDSADAWARLAGAFQNMGRVQECADTCRHALGRNASCALAHYTLGTALKEQGLIREAIASYRRSLVHDPQFPLALSNILYGRHFDPDATPREIYHEHWLFNAVHARPLEKQVRPHLNDRSPQRRLRVGYVSPDFRAHSTSLFTTPLFRWHDRQQVEVFCYSDVSAADVITQDLRQKSDAWRDIVGMTDEQAADSIRADRIDILVDLALHTNGGRPLLFARKPAPIEVTWLGYPGTSGLTTMDYRFTDPWLDPPGLNDEFYFEESVRLPETMWSYEPVETGLAPGPVPALRSGRITFGCLNTFSKANERVIAMWAEVLAAVKNSQMVVMVPAGECRQRFLATLAARGIAADRIEFAERKPWLDYMAMYHQIDIVLDTFPWNGHTMSLDALWMGVPVVTLCGQTAVSRAGLCYLSNLGLSELVAYSAQEYVEMAARLAADLPRLSVLRATMRDRMLSSPLTDTKRFARNVESAYRKMWLRWTST